MATKRQRRINERERQQDAYKPTHRRPSRAMTWLRRLANRVRRLVGIHQPPPDSPAAPNDHLKVYGNEDWVAGDSADEH